MKTVRFWMAPLLVTCAAALAYSQEKKAAPASAPADDPATMKMIEFGTPGPGHKVLAPKVGMWTAEVKMFMAPGAQPEVSQGASEIKWILDGRYLQDTFTGDLMGQPFHGIGMLAFDNMKKKYVSTWVDSMSTGIAVSEGTYDPGTKTFTFQGEQPDPMAGKYVKVRLVEKWTDNDHFSFQSFAPGPDGKEFMGMDIQYTRKK